MLLAQPKEYLAAAERAAHFVKSKLYNEKTKRLTRSFRNGPSKAPGFLDDYAFLIAGLLDLFECGGDYKWLQWALELQTSQVSLCCALFIISRCHCNWTPTVGMTPYTLYALLVQFSSYIPF